MKKYVFLIICFLAQMEGAIPVLVYHGIIQENKEVISNYDISEKSFVLHMEALKKAGYQTITLQDLLAFSRHEKSLPDKPFLITFDDGRKDSLLIDPVLKKLGFTAVMFVVTDPEQMQLPQRLKWEELNQMFQSKRWDMQAHGHFYHNLIPVNAQGTMGHFASNKKWISEKNRLENDLEYQQRLLEDLKTNKSEIEKHIPGSHVIAFAYPFGDYGLDGINVSSSVGIPITIQNMSPLFPLAFTISTLFSPAGGGPSRDGHEIYPLLLPRFVDNGFLTEEELIQLFDQANQQ